MKKLYKVVSTILALCMILTILPVVPFAPAAEVVQRYELDTDGIDTNGVYLIVSANTGSAYALRRNGTGTNNTDVASQAVTVLTDTDGTKYIETGFTNESISTFTFGGSESG
ncbi:MAG: hypothetical protein IIW40_01125, partial [Clostridia bacterium]|nr:hypothetical protein [Clostridia bacterium]